MLTHFDYHHRHHHHHHLLNERTHRLVEIDWRNAIAIVWPTQRFETVPFTTNLIMHPRSKISPRLADLYSVSTLKTNSSRELGRWNRKRESSFGSVVWSIKIASRRNQSCRISYLPVFARRRLSYTPERVTSPGKFGHFWAIFRVAHTTAATAGDRHGAVRLMEEW